MKKLSNIVVGIDCSPACDQALNEAARIAEWNGSKMTVVCVMDQGDLDRMNKQDPAVTSRITSEIEAGVREHVEQILGPGQKEGFEFIVGEPFIELQKAVEHHKAELLVLGSGHEAGHIGAVASKCVRRSDCDVLLVRESQQLGFRKIVACVDFSDASVEAAEEAFRMAKQDGARLEFLHVCPTVDNPAGSRYFIPVSSELLAENNTLVHEASRKKLEAVVEPFTYSGVETSNVLLRDRKHKRAIVDYLKKGGAELVVMGKRGKTNLRSILLGTTAERVINHAGCSVLLVHSSG